MPFKTKIKKGLSGPSDFECITKEFVDAIRSGKSPTVESFSKKYSAHASSINVHFPGIILAEKMRGQNQFSNLQLSPGYMLGNYLIEQEIGRGGMGVVYNAIRTDLESEFAIKVVSAEGASPKSILRFQREAQIVARMHHPSIVPLVDFGHQDGYLYLVMRKVVGITFSNLFLGSRSAADMSRVNNDWRLLAILFQEIAKALSSIHESGFLHRDVKPCNLMLDETSRVWVTDFGLAQLANSTLTHDEPEQPVGTLGYIAPELAWGQCDVRSDIYSLGVTMFEVLAGVRSKDIQMRDRLSGINFRLPDLRELNSNIPSKLARIVKKATHPRPENRYPSADSLAKNLVDFARKRSILSRMLDWKS